MRKKHIVNFLSGRILKPNHTTTNTPMFLKLGRMAGGFCFIRAA